MLQTHIFYCRFFERSHLKPMAAVEDLNTMQPTRRAFLGHIQSFFKEKLRRIQCIYRANLGKI